MTKHIIALAAAAALGVGTFSGVSRAADETNRTGAAAGNNISGTSQTGQTGAAARDATHNAANDARNAANNTANDARNAANNAAGDARDAANKTATDARDTVSTGMQRTGSDIEAALQSANDPDKLFLVCAAMDNQCELQMAQLATQKSQDPKVKEIAQRLIQDHQQAQRDLQQAAQESGVTLPTGTPPGSQHVKRVFESLSGRDFDQQFISHMRAAHAKAVNEYQDVAQLAKNDQIKQFASKTLPTLQQHYQAVQQEATALGLPSGMEAQPAGARMPGR